MESFRLFEEEVANDIADIVQQILAHFQSERERILTSARQLIKAESPSPSPLLYKRTEPFQKYLSRILKKPLAEVSSKKQEEAKKKRKPVAIIAPSTSAPVNQVFEEEKVKRKRARTPSISSKKSPYDGMKVVAVVRGMDYFGQPITGPSSIVAIPGKDQFAFLHNGRISVISASGNLKSTYKIVSSDSGSSLSESSSIYFQSPPWPSLAVDPIVAGRLFRIDMLGQIQTISLPTTSTGVQSKSTGSANGWRQISFFAESPPSGLAISTAPRRLFTAIGNRIYAFSMSDFRVAGDFLVGNSLTSVSVLGVRNADNMLFYTSVDSKGLTTVHAVPICSNGRLEMAEARVALSGSGASQIDHCAIAFDDEANILLTHRNQGIVEVLTPNCDDVLATFGPSSNRYGGACLTDVAVLSAQEGGDLFWFDKGNLGCSRVVATPDFANNMILIFGSVEDAE